MIFITKREFTIKIDIACYLNFIMLLICEINQIIFATIAYKQNNLAY